MTHVLTFAEAHQAHLNLIGAMKMWDGISPPETAPMTDAVEHQAGDEALYVAIYDAGVAMLLTPTNSAADLVTKFTLINDRDMFNMVDWPSIQGVILADVLRIGAVA